jgi:hypothetical protein
MLDAIVLARSSGPMPPAVRLRKTETLTFAKDRGFFAAIGQFFS